MEDDIYKAPNSNLTINDTYKGSPIKAILISVSVDIIGTLVLGMILGFVYAFILASNGMTIDEISNKFTNIDTYSTFSLIGIMLGSFITIYAGYLCAKIINFNEYKTVTILGIVSATFGILLTLTAYNIFEHISFLILTFSCVYFGAWLHVRKKHKNV